MVVSARVGAEKKWFVEEPKTQVGWWIDPRPPGVKTIQSPTKLGGAGLEVKMASQGLGGRRHILNRPNVRFIAELSCSSLHRL